MAGPLMDALYVRVDGKLAAAEGEIPDRGRRVRADAGKLRQVVGPARRCHPPRSAMEVQPTPVVAEPLPCADHLRGRGGRERLRRRPALEPLQVPRYDPFDLRLLKHYLRDEDGVRIARPAPRQVAAVLAEPGQKLLLHAP